MHDSSRALITDQSVSTALPKNPGSIRESSYIHDALQLGWLVIVVEDTGMPIRCGNEQVLIDAATRGW